jgi:hypothetical protein
MSNYVRIAAALLVGLFVACGGNDPDAAIEALQGPDWRPQAAARYPQVEPEERNLAAARRQRGVNDHRWPLLRQKPPGIDTVPSMLPDTAIAASDGATPLTVPDAPIETPPESRAEPEIVPVTEVAATTRLRASGDALPGTRTVAALPERSRSTLNDAVVSTGSSAQMEGGVMPAVTSVIAKAYGPLLRTTGRAGGRVVAGAAGDPPHDPATNSAAASRGVLHTVTCKHEGSPPIKPVIRDPMRHVDASAGARWGRGLP